MHELVLRLFALLIVHPAVVKNARNLRELQRFGDSLDPLPRRAINDAGLVLADQRIQAFVFLRLVRDVRDEQLQIGPRESRHEFPRLAQTKMRQDIAAHFRCGRRGERRHLRAAQRFQNLIEPEIIGPEIVAPHRETMRFVDREKRDRALAERFQKRPTPETFRRDVDELEFASRQCADALALFFGRDRAVYQRGRNSAALERVDLVFHERDQRRDDDGGAFEQERGQLVAKRFAAAGRHHDERIGAAGDRVDHFLLGIEKLPEAKIFFENVVRGHWDFHCGG